MAVEHIALEDSLPPNVRTQHLSHLLPAPPFPQMPLPAFHLCASRYPCSLSTAIETNSRRISQFSGMCLRETAKQGRRGGEEARHSRRNYGKDKKGVKDEVVYLWGYGFMLSVLYTSLF